MICASCRSDNEPGRKFCGECGQPLALLCPSCRAPNAPGLKFCGECGSPLASQPRPVVVEIPRTADIAPDGGAATERRHVSVLFADLVGFTSLSETRDPEEVRELLSKYFDASRRLIDRLGGVVEKFIGDAVMAVWGTPAAREDDAERAVRAALGLVEAVVALGFEAGIPSLKARAGVLTGEAVVTLGARGQGMVAGDLVNTASRIQSAARPGEVYVGEATRRSSETNIAYEDAGLHELKGKAEPLPLWRAVRVVGLLGGAVRQTELEPPLMGRERELHLIKELFHASAEERRAHLVSVIGIGGIGKSRLAWEFEKHVDGLVSDVLWHRGRCLSYGDGVAFWALAEMVRMRAGIVEDEDAGSARAKLHTTLEKYVPSADEIRFVEPRLLHLLGVEDRTAGDQENLFSAWRIFFERVSETSPIVMLFDDVHWADTALLDFIEYLVDWSREHPVFIFTLARPELSDRRPTWGAAKRSFTSLFLEPLSAASMTALLRAPIPDLPDDLLARILERAEGVPFYAVETVRMLIDRGILVRDGATYQVAGNVDTLAVPESLQALIAARLAGLAPVEREILQDASVMGRTFTMTALASLTTTAAEDLEPVLTSLIRKEVLSISSDPLSPERGQYGFLQELVRKVAYETMSKHKRRSLHIAAAEFLEQGLGFEEDEVIEVVAAHYLDAYLAAPDAEDADTIKEKALDRLVRAADRASSLGANLVAQRTFERAASLAPDPLRNAELLERAGVMAENGLRTDDAMAHYEASIAIFEAHGATHAAARVSARLGEQLWNRGRVKDSLDSMDRAFAVLIEEARDPDVAWLAAQIGRFQFFAGDPNLAMHRIETALEIAEAESLPEVLSQALNTKSLILQGRGRRVEGSALLERALAVAIEGDKPSAALRAYNNLVDMMTAEDRYQDAQDTLNEGLALARRMGNRTWEQLLRGQPYPLYCLARWDEALEQMAGMAVEERFNNRTAFGQGYMAFTTAIHVQRGELDDAARHVALFTHMAIGSDDAQERADYACAEATLLSAQGDHRGALAAAWRAREEGSRLGIWHYTVKEAVVQGVESAIAAGDLGAAEDILAQVASLPAGDRSRYLETQTQRLRALVAWHRGETAEVASALDSAIQGFRRLMLPFWTAVALLEQSDWLATQGRAADTADALVEARQTFRRLRAEPWLQRMAKLDLGGSVTGAAEPPAAVAEGDSR
ncbi:MAG: adenylate/guanylate cyclase domain-containing protein [Candidatus Dormibacteria bacterium]